MDENRGSSGGRSRDSAVDKTSLVADTSTRTAALTAVTDSWETKDAQRSKFRNYATV